MCVCVCVCVCVCARARARVHLYVSFHVLSPLFRPHTRHPFALCVTVARLNEYHAHMVKSTCKAMLERDRLPCPAPEPLVKETEASAVSAAN